MQSARTWPWSAAKQARAGNIPSTVSGPLSDSPTPGEPRFRGLWDPLTADPKARRVGLACKGRREGKWGRVHGELWSTRGPRQPLHPRESVARAPGAAGSEQSFCADLGENSLRILEADYQRYVILHMRNFRNGTATQVLALYGTVPGPLLASRGPIPGEVRVWPRPEVPAARGMMWRVPTSSRCPTPATPSPRLPSPHGPKLLCPQDGSQS